MEWLKDKKNTPKVAALMVALIVIAGGTIAWTQGLFSGSTTTATAPVAPTGPPGSVPPGGPGGPPGFAGGPPQMRPRTLRGVPPARPAVGVATVAAIKRPDNVNPANGPDPFRIPNGAKKLADLNAKLAGPKLPLRDAIGPLNLFQIHPPAPPPAPALPDVTTSTGNGNTVTADPASHYRLSGIINGTAGINAIVEVDGQSQSVKPGDSLSDGSRVTNIQATSVTLRTANGAALNLQLSAGSPDQGTNTQNFNGFNGQAPFQPGFPQQGQNN